MISKEKNLKKKDFEERQNERKNEAKINKMVEKERKW